MDREQVKTACTSNYKNKNSCEHENESSNKHSPESVNKTPTIARATQRSNLKERLRARSVRISDGDLAKR